MLSDCRSAVLLAATLGRLESERMLLREQDHGSAADAIDSRCGAQRGG